MIEKSTEQLVRDLSDREAIRDLVTRYCQVIWREELDEYPLLFTEDAVVRWTNPGHRPPVHGRAALRELVGKLVHAHRKPRQFMHNHIAQLLGPDTAKGQCCVEVRFPLDGEDGYLVCYYDDDYVKINGEWKFQLRECTIEYLGPRAGYMTPDKKTTASWAK